MGFLARLFVGLTVFGLVATAILAELGEIWWAADLLGHFRFPYLVIAAAALLVALLVRPRWRALLVVLAAAPHAWAIGTYPTAPWSTQSDTGTRLRVVTANLLYDNPRLADAAAWLRRTNADILCLQEIVGAHARLVAALRGAYPHYGPQHSRSDTLLFSRYPIVRQRVELPGEYLRRKGRASPGEGYPFHIADIRTPGGVVRVLCVHPLPPVMPRLIGQHRAQFAAWPIEAAAARKAGLPVIMVGDFNATPYSPRFRTLLAEAGVRVAGPRLFWPATWPVGGPLAALTGWPALQGVTPGLLIDHVLVSPRFAVAGFRRGPDIGADHHPIVVDLVLGARAAGRR